MVENYRVVVEGKHLTITNAIRDYVMEKLAKTEKLSADIIDVVVRLEVHKLQHECTIIMRSSHVHIKIHSSTEDLYSAIDRAFDKLKSKLVRWKTKIQNHHAKGVSVVDMEVQVLEHLAHLDEERDQDIVEENNATLDRGDQRPKIVKKKTRPLKTLTLDEAWMKMDLTNDAFMVYRSEEDRSIKVIYRRRDGGYGVIATQ
ncbi:MAG: ribosome-associated translation inhibitor RaiA [Simkaniaceae bacterium]|nr:ribosome-associated translation inhibitor RaiA [Simkaniaceae bacterium]